MVKSNFQKAVEQSTIARGFPIDTKHVYTPAEAQAMIANLIANPIPAVNGTKSLDVDLGIFGGLKSHYTSGRSGYHVDDVRVDDDNGAPTKPDTRYFTGSTVGNVIPISMGKRRLDGNIIVFSDITPRMVGTKTYIVTYEVPIYEDPPVDDQYGFQLDTSGGNIDPGDPDPPASTTCSQDQSCDTKSPPASPPNDDPTDNPTDPPDGSGIFYFTNGFDGGPGSCASIHTALSAGDSSFTGTEHFDTEAGARARYNERISEITSEGEGAIFGRWNGTTNTLLAYECTQP